MSGVLDPNGLWFWSLYALAGAGVVTLLYPAVLNSVTQLERDTWQAHAGPMALIKLIFWGLWPLCVGWLLVGAIWVGFWWAYGHALDMARRVKS